MTYLQYIAVVDDKSRVNNCRLLVLFPSHLPENIIWPCFSSSLHFRSRVTYRSRHFSPPPYYGARFIFYREKSSPFSSLVDSRRIALCGSDCKLSMLISSDILKFTFNDPCQFSTGESDDANLRVRGTNVVGQGNPTHEKPVSHGS